MRNRIITLLLSCLVVSLPHYATANDPLRDLDLFIQQAMADWQIPGLAIAVVKDDRVVYLKGFGVRQIGRPERVDAETIFSLGSCTKGFTATAAALLVDEGKLSWDDRIVRHVPALRLANDWVTREVTLRDLLSHRVAGGWGGSSMPMILVTSLGHDEILERMHRLGGDGSGFRSRFQYENSNFAAAGRVIASVSGMSWSEFMKRRIFEPLAMRSATADVRDLWSDRAIAGCVECDLDGHRVSLEDARVENVAAPHRLGDDGPETAPVWPLFDNPSGGIHASIGDAAKWLRFQLAGGSFEGKPILSTKVLNETHEPQIVVPPQSSWPHESHFWAYGLGWFLTEYRGRKVVLHGGGFTSAIAMMPEEGIGVAVLANIPNSLRRALPFHIFDRYLGPPAPDWNGRMLKEARERRERDREERAEERSAAPVEPASPLSSYSGTYEHPAYGTIVITEERDSPVLRFPGGATGDLAPAKPDEFTIVWRGPDRFRSAATFEREGERVDAVTLRYPPGTFKRVPENDSRILFDSNRDGSGEIYSIRSDGSDLRRLTHLGRKEAFSRLPDWSPDRNSIVFQSNRDGRWPDLYVMNAGGGSVRRLTDTESASEGAPAWSPDGTLIAYDRTPIAADGTRGDAQLWIVGADGSNPTPITSAGRNWYPAWSPDGKTIAFVSDRDGDLDLYVMNRDGTNVRQLTNAPSSDGAPAWSPDGTQIAFDSTRDGNYELYVVDAGGSNPRRLTRTPARSEARPTWSPDGRWIAFNAGVEGEPATYEICLIDVNGANVRCLTDDEFFDAHPDCS